MEEGVSVNGSGACIGEMNKEHFERVSTEAEGRKEKRKR